MLKLFTRTDTTTTKQTLRLYREAMQGNEARVVTAGLFITLATAAYTVFIPLFLSLIIQSLISYPDDISRTYPWLVSIVVASIITIIFNDRGYRWLFNSQEYVMTHLTQRAVTHLLARSHSFFADRKVGTLTGDVVSLARSFMSVTDGLILQALGIAVNFVASLIIIAFLSPVLLLPLTLLTVGVVVMALRALNKRSPLRNERKRLMSLHNGSIADVLSNSLLVRVFARTKSETDAIITERRQIENVALEEITIIQNEANLRFVVLFVFQISTVILSIWLFAQGNITIAALVFATTYLGRISGSLFNINGFIRQMEQGFLDAAPMTKILMEKIEITDATDATELKVNQAAIDCRSISFHYTNNKAEAVFKDLNLHIQPGERVGLAGHSGGGKTTFTQLLLRFADLDKGQILVDGQDIAHVTQTSLHAQIAYVPQDPFLFHRSLRDNIAYAKPDANKEEILQAAQRAHALEFIDKLPQGLDTVVGERGVKLSGGQRQRIAIARAILKDAPILILDEATSALDSESEQLIQSSLDGLMQGRTSIVIAHRLSTIAKLDRIIVLDDGKIVEDGTHSELLEQNGTYARLWSHQSGGFIED